MSTHPNVILAAVITVDGTSRKTMRDILGDETPEDDDIKIGRFDYHHIVMESDYDEGWQISAKEGDLVFFDLVTYGYGEVIKWGDLESQKNELDEWCALICDKHKCSYEIIVTANYW